LRSYKVILDANPGVDPNKLKPGQKLKIPPPPTATTPQAQTGPSTGATANGQDVYTVKSGDTLSKIATDKHTTVKALRSENNLTTDRIVVGQKLKIPKATAPAPATPTP